MSNCFFSKSKVRSYLAILYFYLFAFLSHAQEATVATESPVDDGDATVIQKGGVSIPPPEVSAEVSKEAATIEPSMFELLGQTVPKNESAILSWRLESGLDSGSAPVSVLVVNGKEAGPTLCLTAAVHGDELNGIEIVRRIVHETKPDKLKGVIVAVPIVNLEGFKRATRYLPDRRDLNRYFPGRATGSYASRIAYSFFENIVRNCDYLIDIHTGSLDRTNLPQLRADLNNRAVADLAEKMGSIVVLQSRGGFGTLRRAATDAGIPAVTIETGAPNNLQKEAVEKGVDSVKSAMRSLGLVESRRWERSKEPIYFRSSWIRAETGGMLFSRVELGDKVKEGTVLGLISNPVTNKTTRIKSTQEGRVIGMSLNRIMHPGFAAYHIGLKSSAIEAAQPESTEEPSLTETEDMQDSASVPPTKPDTVTDGESEEKADDVSPSPETVETPEVDVKPIEDMELPTADDAK